MEPLGNGKAKLSICRSHHCFEDGEDASLSSLEQKVNSPTPPLSSSAHTLSNHDKTRVKSTWILQPAVLDLYSPGLYISRTGSCNKPNSA
ncbi:hypothetical protein SRHO_G00026710 [Serrasalmus rhombeus]